MLIMLLAACAPFDREILTVYFEPLDDGFKYIVSASGPYGIDDADAEQVRIDWINHFVEQNGLCPGGYEIVERKAARGKDAVGGEAGYVFYTGRCI